MEKRGPQKLVHAPYVRNHE